MWGSCALAQVESAVSFSRGAVLRHMLFGGQTARKMAVCVQLSAASNSMQPHFQMP
eukprot:CAMPEP_0179146276 /NCGR_PEP_ID=MMETSP0796-20121207/70623_1 /TAXON_ID=73915 /ORGANISM="Pyrodinium bahamense, Strain pbaha01" /LENGTH=55 /DNA_ID=CAMNT_0020846735 /DNA_START=9 /DNA_END=173 /DNA_ORIENTATION=-